MTKEEYKKLLMSDYWKGYSYSLIKERNFTCEDCKRRFYNERNKLQVHHLIYRDVNPWSYRPEEVVVLCEECHRKRHGYTPKPSPLQNTQRHAAESLTHLPNIEDDFDTRWHRNVITQAQHIGVSTEGTTLEILDRINRKRQELRIANIQKNINNQNNKSYQAEPQPRIKFRYIVYVFLLLFALLIGINNIFIKPQAIEDQIEKVEQINNVETNTTNPPITNSPNTNKKTTTKNQSKSNKKEEFSKEQDIPTTHEQSHNIIPSLTEQSTPIISNELKVDNHVNSKQGVETTRELSTMELLERKSHANAVERAKEVGVSTEGTTLEILERISHANTVERAKEVGVSTEGTTLEILERISHANTVERAKEIGVSTEGTTLEILERISHANAVERAKEIGVSTEGTTLDILERMSRKRLEKYNQ